MKIQFAILVLALIGSSSCQLATLGRWMDRMRGTSPSDLSQQGNLTLYYNPFSSPSRCLLTIIDLLNLNATKVLVDLPAGEHLTPEYEKINPHKSVPCLVHDTNNGTFTLTESRAEAGYLVSNFAPGNPLYPSDPKQKAQVDNALYWDATTLYPGFLVVVYPILKEGADINQAELSKTDKKLAQFDKDISKSKFAAGQQLTIADISLFTTVKSLECTQFWDITQYPNIQRWMADVKPLLNVNNNYDNIIETPNTQYGYMIRQKLQANRASKAQAQADQVRQAQAQANQARQAQANQGQANPGLGFLNSFGNSNQMPNSNPSNDIFKVLGNLFGHFGGNPEGNSAGGYGIQAGFF